MSETARATGKARMCLRELNEHRKAEAIGFYRWRGFVLPDHYPGLEECLEAGWVEASHEVSPRRYRITKAGGLELGYAGDEIDDGHDNVPTGEEGGSS